MPIFTVGPNSTYPSIAAAMLAAGPNDTIQLEAGYSNETAVVTHTGMIITGDASSVGIVLQLGNAIATVALAGAAAINLLDAIDGNGIVGNDGNNLITVTAGADSVSGGLGHDRLFVDYRLATGAVTGDSTSNVTEAGGGARMVTINGGFEDFTIWTGAGADTITTGAGDDDIRTGEGAGTVTTGGGDDILVGGSGDDRFVFGSDYGNDTISDFDSDASGGQDLLDISAFGVTPGTFAADVTVNQVGLDTVISIGGGSITLTGINAGTDFLF